MFRGVPYYSCLFGNTWVKFVNLKIIWCLINLQVENSNRQFYHLRYKQIIHANKNLRCGRNSPAYLLPASKYDNLCHKLFLIKIIWFYHLNFNLKIFSNVSQRTLSLMSPITSMSIVLQNQCVSFIFIGTPIMCDH